MRLPQAPLHHREALATHPTCRVEQCRCGEVHLSIGGVTLRLEREAFLMIADVCASAARVAMVRGLHRAADAADDDDDPRLS